MIWSKLLSCRTVAGLILACGLMACSTTIESDETTIESAPVSPTVTAVPTKIASPTPEPTLTESTPTQSQIDENGESALECDEASLIDFMVTKSDEGRYDEGIQEITEVCEDSPRLLAREGLMATVVAALREQGLGPTYTIFEADVPDQDGDWDVAIVQDGVRHAGREVFIENRPFVIEVEMDNPQDLIWAAEPFGDNWDLNDVGVTITQTRPIIGFNTLWSLNTIDIDPEKMPYLCRCLDMRWLVSNWQRIDEYHERRRNDAGTTTFSLPIEAINDRPISELDGLHLYLQFFIDDGNKVIDEGELHKIKLVIDDSDAAEVIEAMAWQNDVTAKLHNDGLVEIQRQDGESEFHESPIYAAGETGWQPFPYELRVINMDEDDEPEVAAVISSPGASCCTSLTVFDYWSEIDGYRSTPSLYTKYTLGFRFGWQDAPTRGPYHVWSLNESFHADLGGASVTSIMSPLKILRLQDWDLVDVTAEFPSEIERHLELFFMPDGSIECLPFAVGGYLAEMALLDRYDDGMQAAQDSCAEWVTAEEWDQIDQALARFGYKQ